MAKTPATGPLYAISAANGHIGSALARLLVDGGSRVRALGRDAKKLATLGASERAFGSLDDAMYLGKALSDADAAFVMIPPNYATTDFPSYSRRVTEAFVKALAASKATHVVALSSVGGDLSQGTGLILSLHQLEERLATLGKHLLILRPAYFLENHLNAIPVIKATASYAAPTRADLAFPMIATRDIAAHAARRLQALDFQGLQVQELLGAKDYTMATVAATLGKEIGKADLPYVQIPYEQAHLAMRGAGITESVSGLFIEMQKAFNEGLIKPTQPRSPASTTPTTLGQFARQFAQAFKASL